MFDLHSSQIFILIQQRLQKKAKAVKHLQLEHPSNLKLLVYQSQEIYPGSDKCDNDKDEF